MEKFIVMLSLLTIGCQSRQYFYNKPLAPFHNEDGSQPQYVSTSHRMIIPGVHGRNYEVSMSPARNIFEMHLGRHQHYVQQQQGQNAYTATAGAQYAGGSGGFAQSLQQQSAGYAAGYGQYQAATNAQQKAGVYAPNLSQQSDNLDAYALALTQNNLGSYAQGQSQGVANFGSHAPTRSQQFVNTLSNDQQNSAAPGVYAQNLSPQITRPGTGAQSYYAQNSAQQGSSAHNNGRPVSRLIRKCYPNGHCEYIVDDRQHQQVLQQARAHVVPVNPNCSRPSAVVQSQRHTSTPTNVIKKGLRDRRLFPYSEVPIGRYPNKK